MCQTNKDAEEKKMPELRLPQSIRPAHYDISLSLNEEKGEFIGYEQIHAEVLEKTNCIQMHASGQIIHSVRVRQAASKGAEGMRTIGIEKISQDNGILQINTEPMDEGQIEISLLFEAKLNPGMAGFYKSRNPMQKNGYIYSTQFESTSARLAFPCWDEPGFKAVFKISISVPKKYVVLSNSKEEKVMNGISEEKIIGDIRDKDAYRTVVFKPTLLMSTYLVAWVIGDLEAVEQGRIRVYSPTGQKEKGMFALETARHCLEFFEKYFEIPYQMEKLDMVAIPEFSAGAMENWGLITYRSSSLHYTEGSTTAQTKLLIAETVCHELAHQWFGNLVTMKWWNDLWLNEGFATWAGTLATASIAKEIGLELDPWEEFLVHDISRGMAMDGKLSTHAVNLPVISAGEISSMFDEISYSKGASLIHMLANYLGHENFRDGLRAYIRKYQYSNTSTSDLWRALDPETERGVALAMKDWLDRPGMPHLTVELSQDQITVSQRRYLPKHDEEKDGGAERASSTPWKVFLTVKTIESDKDEEGDRQIPEKEKKDSDGNEHSIQQTTAASLFETERKVLEETQNGLFILNAESAGFYRVHYAPEVLDAYVKPALKTDRLSDFDRFGIFRDACCFAIDGHEKAACALDLFSYISKKERASVISVAASFLQYLRNAFEDEDEIRDKANRALTNLLLPYAERADDLTSVAENVEQRKAEVLAVGILARIPGSAVQKKVFELYESGRVGQIHPEYKLPAYIALALERGQEGYDFLVQVISDAKDENEKLRAITAIAFSKESFDDAFKLFAEENDLVLNQDKIRMIPGISAHRHKKEVLDKLFQAFPDMRNTFRATPDHISRFVSSFISVQNTEEGMSAAKHFFDQPGNLEDGWARGVEKGLDSSRILIGFCERNRDDLLARDFGN